MNQAELKDSITALIIKAMEEGNTPWRKGWATSGFAPTSLQTGKAYQGINSLLLSFLGSEYSRPLWVTYKNAQTLGGNVRKGEKGTPVVYASKVTKEQEGKETRTFFTYRYSTVFNIDQCDGLTLPAIYSIKREPVAITPAIQGAWDNYLNRPELFYREQAGAFYSPSGDSITLPALHQFEDANEHAYTLAHEMIHSTGHESRLNRWTTPEDKPSKFGCASYAREELIAELGACMLLSNLGADFDLPNSAAYVKNWLTALKNDSSLIFKASAKAQAAANLIQGVKVQEEVSA